MISSLSLIGPALAGVAVPAGGIDNLLVIASTGIVGMGLSDLASGLFSDDEEEESGGADEEGDFMGEGSVDEDGLGDGDEFGDLDGWDDDDELGGGGGGGSNADLEPRLDELENELESISSSMGTVRSENEAINETVDEIEDNIRKLLDIYEMVTRGVNPFVDDVQGGGGMDGSFGLFEDSGDDGGETDDLDPDVADADPDDFFDDDFDAGGDDEFEDEFEDGGGGDLDDDAAAEQASVEEGEGGGSGGKTFDDLKSEYQSGEADWDDEDAAPAPSEQEETVALTDDEDDAASPSETVGEGDEGTAATAEEVDDGEVSESVRSDGKPYLESLPAGYASELLLIEWLTYLREASDTSEALRALKYYETIGWVGEDATSELQRYLTGLGGEGPEGPTGGTQLTIDHHTNSLRYIGRLGGADVDVERLEWGAPGPAHEGLERREQRGIQR